MVLIILLEILIFILALGAGILHVIDRICNLGFYQLVSAGYDLSKLHVLAPAGDIVRACVPVVIILALLVTVFHFINDIYRKTAVYITVKEKTVNAALCVSVLALLGIAGIDAGFIYEDVNIYRNQCDIVALRNELADYGAIVHAAGGIYSDDGEYYIYTNCYEALCDTLKEGNRFVEIDLLHASDDVLICTHYEKYFDVDSAHFLAGKLDGGFTPMSIDTLAEIMYDHPDLIFITDIKDRNIGGCTQIMTKYPDLADRFIIQIYHASQYEPIRALGFKYIIYTLYDAFDEELETPALNKAMAQYDILGMTFWEAWMDKEELFGCMQNSHLPMYVHTVDDVNDIRKDFAQGISAVYTNNIDNLWMRQ